MRHLKSIGIALLAASVLIGGIGLLLKKDYRVERKLVINAPADTIFHYVSDLSTWQDWTVWNKEADPSLKISYGKSEGRIVKMNWQGDVLEKGELAISKVVDNKELNFLMVLEESFQSKGRILLENKKSGTKVTWIVEGDVGNNIIQRYFILLADNFIGPDLEESLRGLKKISETEKE